MRFLGVSETCDLADLYLSLRDEGHLVRIAISEVEARGTLANMVEQVADWKAELDWIREAGPDGVILFESVSKGFGALQDELRRAGFHVIGGSAFGDRLENDRAFAQSLLASIGLPVARLWEFSDAGTADRFIATNPGRYVLKFSGADHSADDTFVGQLADGGDVRIVMASKLADRADARFILMEHLHGVEMGVGAYFDGERFLEPACLDWEHKRFFAGDLGELTGEMGTVATFDCSRGFFARTLKKLETHFREAGHVGYVNLNTIVNEQGIWPLEFTCRFGYPGFAVLAALQQDGWSSLFRTMIARDGACFATQPGFAVGVVVTTPPFPYSRLQVAAPVGMPIHFDASLDASDRAHIHYGEVGQNAQGLVTSGLYGWTMVVTGVGTAIPEAKQAAYARVRRITIPNARYRLDIGDRLIATELAEVQRLGLLDAEAP
ncbi:phosphoribosylamine--glycine ligase [Sphingomonas sp. JC676]|uniref:phosphoribosylamine--glycine ligase n=1 Tax=Sphingomonas sp. JC676 TaxID=2768065 RepID=UPI00165799DF|nr:phosphoribosylamine--glycine ligase [Sphingomonas sp. JC676]MBC9033901.1 phosphoribosylamine--glycine ligase [Sphingomonas sp. JC676]